MSRRSGFSPALATKVEARRADALAPIFNILCIIGVSTT